MGKVAMNPKDIPVVILAGGKGTRLSEETRTIPKPLLEIGDVPIIGHIIRHYKRYGFRDFYIPVGYLGGKIAEYFVRSDEFRDTVYLRNTGEETQTGGRVGRLAEELLGSTFMLTYGDGLSDVNLADLLNYHQRSVEEQGTMVTITAVHPVPRFGSIEMNKEGFVTKFGEKELKRHDWINGGFMVMESELLLMDMHDDTNLEKDILPIIAKNGQLKGFIHEGFWHCIDTLRDLEAAREMYSRGEAEWIFGKTKK